MRRKEVLKRLKSVAEVRASLYSHRGKVGGQLDERPASLSAEGVSYQGTFDNMDSELAKIERDLITAEDEHVNNLVRIAQLRRQGRELTSDVYATQTAVRKILSGLYGSDRDFELAAISGKTPQTAQALAEQVDQTVKLLRNPLGPAPPEKADGVSIDFEKMASGLEGGCEKLLGSRSDLQRTLKAADGTRILTCAAIKGFDQVFPWVARSLEGFFRLAGEHDLADRVRTSARRVTRRQAAGPEEEAEESQADGTVSVESAAVGTSEPSGATPASA